MSAHRYSLALLSAALVFGCEAPDPGTAGPPPRSCRSTGVETSSLTHLTRVELGFAAHDLFGADETLATLLPIDDSTTGFEVGAATSPLLVEQYLTLAESAASSAAADDTSASALTGCSTGDEACVARWITRIGRRAFRRDVQDAERDDLLALYRVGTTSGGFAGGVRLVVQGILSSADFLYHTEGSSQDASGELVRLDAYGRAARLAFLYWRSVPDDALLDDAASGNLETDVDLHRAAARLLADPRSSRMIADFYRQWLALDRIDTAISTQLTGTEVRQMHADLSAYVERVTRGGVYRDLLIPPGVGLPPTAGGPATEPARGVLTAPGILLVLSRASQTDPIHRGLYVRERFLCQHLPPPPPGVVFSVPESAPGLTTRERFAVHTAQADCARCHRLIDPIGFGFEHYDEVGRWRDTEGELAIDATGEIVDGGDATGTFDGAQQLAERLAESDIARECFARQWFRFAMQRVETASDQCSIDTMVWDFYANDLRIDQLMLSVTRTEAFTHRRIPVGE